MQQYRGIIFDLDGTLLNSLGDIAESANAALVAMNMPPHPIDRYRYFVGDGVAFLMQRILPESVRDDEAVRAECLRRYVSIYAQNWANRTCPYPGIAELLDEIDRVGLKKGVFSNKPAECTEQCVAQLLGRWKFDAVVGQKDGVIPKKPDPTGGLVIMKQWGCEPSEILYVGDTSTDMMTAKNAGFHSIGVTWGFRPEEELRASGAEWIVHEPSEIVELF